jgi:serine/threonine protein kinase
MGARGRLDPDRVSGMHAATHRPLAAAITRVLEGIDRGLQEAVVASSLDNLLACIPKAIAHLVAATVWRVADLPVDGSRSPPTERTHRTSPPSRDVLPAWLPAGRTIGGFYVLRPLSAGAVGSVFVATRAEDRADPNAERLALKVPEYSASAARQLSEAEFLKMFRDEAGALIGLPQHPNLARFVTFDAGSKPKPILVMELVEGVTLERLLAARSLDVTRALRVLDDVLAALEAMHTAGVGHLDLKPSNVVMRRGEQAVLVDFGLAGRHIRPGCATGPYGAPEVWGAVESEEAPSPAKADVYAFGCVAFETLLGRTLFDASSEMALISMHVAHDGHPAALRALSGRPAMAGLVEFLASALRCEPKKRLTASALRRDLSRLAPSFAGFPWPLDA